MKEPGRRPGWRGGEGLVFTLREEAPVGDTSPEDVQNANCLPEELGWLLGPQTVASWQVSGWGASWRKGSGAGAWRRLGSTCLRDNRREQESTRGVQEAHGRDTG